MRNPKMRMPWLFAILTVGLLAFAGCEAAEEEPPAEVIAEAAREAEFVPPEDGRLTANQLETYLRVREREQQLVAEAAQGVEEEATGQTTATVEGAGEAPAGEVTVTEVPATTAARSEMAEILAADVRAAREMGVDPLEYQWIKGEVLRAQIAYWADEWEDLGVSGREQVLETLGHMASFVQDPELKREVDDTLADLRRGEALKTTDEDLRHNVELVARYEQQLRDLTDWPEAGA